MILRYLNRNNRIQSHTYLLDATPLDVDYNFDSKKISKKNLEKKRIQNGVMEQVLASI